MTAFLFPGQGSQYVGMGKEWAEGSPIAREYFERADAVLGRGLSKLCFVGPEDELTDTRNAQLAIYVVSCISARLLMDRSLAPSYVAGHSIGEYPALVAAESIDFDTGVALVKERANAMADAGEANPGTMAAIIRMEPHDVENTVREIDQEGPGCLSVAGFNSPEQTVISGSVECVERAMEVLKEKGARRVIPLSVSGAFHSDLMMSARERLQKAVEATEFRPPKIPFISNNTGQPAGSVEEIRNHLPRQLTSPVRWTATMEYLVREGCESFVDTGPGMVVSGLLKKFDPGLKCVTVSDLDSFDAVVD